MNAIRPMTVSPWKPSPPLAPFVSGYRLREAGLGAKLAYVPLPARTDCFLEFYLEERYRIVDLASGVWHWAPRCALVGPQTRRREDLILSGSLRVFTIQFSAVGFRALFGVPAHAICDVAVGAEAVLGRGVLQLAERLAAADSGESMRGVAEAFLLERMARGEVTPAGRVAARVARRLTREEATGSVRDLAQQCGMTPRHVERIFQEHVGMSPKVFYRLHRLRRALQMAETTDEEWTSIAAACGYFDQSHMLRDFRGMMGESPARFAALRQRASALAQQGADDVAFVLSAVCGTTLR